MTTNIMIVGVGGQGSLLASKMLGQLLLTQGYDVKVSEVHGMSQRGGSVVTYVRFGDHVYSPIIEQGEADMIISFEQLEAARWLPYLKEGGKIVTSTQQIDPMPVITGAAEYPQHLIEKMRAVKAEVDAIDALPDGGRSRFIKSGQYCVDGTCFPLFRFSAGCVDAGTSRVCTA